MKKNVQHILRILKENYLPDIRFWIILFFVIRLCGITNAPIEISHSWRQSLTNMIARNFLEIDNNILYPRIDMDGNKTGIIASEFPFYNYLIYLTSAIFGYAHWYGRIINLFVSSICIFYFYKLIKLFFSREHAFYSSLILLSSIWFAFSRKSMPDTFCISLVIIGIYYGFQHLYVHRFRDLVLFFFFSSLAVLCKIPALYLLSILVIPLFDCNIPKNKKVNILMAGVFILAVVYLWYFYWVPYLLATFGFQLYFPRHFVEGVKELLAYGPDTMEKFYFSAFQSFVAFAVFLTGLFLIFRQKAKIAISVFIIGTLFFFLFIIKTGFVFSIHNYYVIPYVPIMAFVAGVSIIEIKINGWKIFVIGLIICEGLLNQLNDFRIKPSETYKLTLESIADKVSRKEDLVAVNGGKNPQLIYFLHRRGWSLSAGEIEDANFLNTIADEGCKYVFVDKHLNMAVALNLHKKKTIVFENEHFIVYSLWN